MGFSKTPSIVRKSARPVIVTLRKWAWKLLPYMPDRMTQEQYDALYSSRRLDYYRDVSELGRYSVIVGYCHYFKPGGAVLDLGCGAGILQERLHSNTYSCYVGVDRSKEAIGQVPSRLDENTSFVVADVALYVPDRKFDVIILNECLYHFDDPMSVLKKYEDFLNRDGCFVISICDAERTKPLWKMLEATYRAEDEVQIRNKSTISWTIKVFKPSRQNPQDLYRVQPKRPSVTVERQTL